MGKKAVSSHQYVFPFIDGIEQNSLPWDPAAVRDVSSRSLKEKDAVKATDAGTIYAVGIDGGSHVKIGKTTVSIQKRMAGLQSGHPARVHLLATVAVKQNLSRIELAIHRLLAKEWQRGEWFAVEMDQDRLESLVLRAVQWLEKEDRLPVKKLNSAAQLLRKRAGSKPGKVRFAKLTEEERSAVGRNAAHGRWVMKRERWKASEQDEHHSAG